MTGLNQKREGYRPEPEKKHVVSERASLAIGHILENTVKFGTGSMADRNVKLSSSENNQSPDEDSLSVPLLGKTGTANRYTNASFLGYLPSLSGEGEAFRIPGGYAVGVYVGYDDNKPMRKGTTRITGAAGALPAWIDIVNSLIRKNNYAADLDPVDLSFYGLILKRDDIGQVNIGIETEVGGITRDPVKKIDEVNRYQPSIMTFGSIGAQDTFKTAQEYAPFWMLESKGRQFKAGKKISQEL